MFIKLQMFSYRYEILKAANIKLRMLSWHYFNKPFARFYDLLGQPSIIIFLLNNLQKGIKMVIACQRRIKLFLCLVYYWMQYMSNIQNFPFTWWTIRVKFLFRDLIEKLTTFSMIVNKHMLLLKWMRYHDYFNLQSVTKHTRQRI